MKHSISEAARIVGVTRKTFYKHIDKKSITVEKDENDNPVIDASELMRVYGDQCNFDKDKQTKDTGQGKQRSSDVPSVNSPDVALLSKEVELLKREIEARQDEVERWQSAFDKAQSTADKITALLEDKSSGRAGEWQKSLKALESRIANQEKAAREDKEARQKILRQNQALKKALTEEKNKPLWKRLFG